MAISSPIADLPASLQQAQERLLSLRRLAQARRAAADLPAPHDTSPLPHLRDLLEALPAHLGWHSQAVRRACAPARRARPARRAALQTPPGPTSAPAACPAAVPAPSLAIYPDLALALLRQNRVAPGRVWLLLRHLDTAGKGWLAEGDARTALTSPASPWRLCGPRQLRNLLEQGAPDFWTRRDGRLWLRSLPRVAATLGVTRFATPAVLLPAKQLTGRVGTARAHLYACFHSSRATIAPDGRRQAPPIARQTLSRLTRLSRHTQRRYEAVAGVRRQANIAVGAPLTASEAQARAGKHGHAQFRFLDRRGLQGPVGQAYVAWQLPNSYLGPHARSARRQRRRLNRQLADLLQQGMTGNDKRPPAEPVPRRPQRFFRDGRQAATGFNRRPDRDAYWPQQRPMRAGRLWRVLPGDATGGPARQ